MGKIFITGDTHGEIDIGRLDEANFPKQEKLSKNDYIIITGDFGLVWSGGDNEKRLRKKLDERNFTTLFIDGNHENFDLLEKYPIVEWNGGKVQFIERSIIRLMRGQVYTINGIKFFTMGGGKSIDKIYRKEGLSWWKQEQPSKEELDEGIDNLEKHNWKVDIVLTHTTSVRMMEEMGYMKEFETLNRYFDFLEKELDYKYWFFGHFHEDMLMGKHRLVYNDIIEISKHK